MNFCPICNKNYDTEEHNCPNCNCTLLAGNEEDFFTLYQDTNEELIMRLYNLLIEQDYTTAQYIEYNDSVSETKQYLLLVSSEDALSAIQDILDFLQGPDSFFTDIICEKVSTQMQNHLKEFIPDEGSKQYVDSKTKYEDIMSSAQSLITVSIIGFIFELLVLANVIPLNMNVLFYILCTLMLGAFLILGIQSLLKAKSIKANCDDEASLTEDIKTFLQEEFDASELEASFSEETLEEEKYFSRNQLAKEQIQNRFGNVDLLLVDSLFDELYNELFITVQNELD